jgi:hypothetical protein
VARLFLVEAENISGPFCRRPPVAADREQPPPGR